MLKTKRFFLQKLVLCKCSVGETMQFICTVFVDEVFWHTYRIVEVVYYALASTIVNNSTNQQKCITQCADMHTPFGV